MMNGFGRAVALSLFAAQSVAAQVIPAVKANVISMQPLTAVLGVFSGEYERAASQSTSIGVGATYWGSGFGGGDFTYLSGDFKLRYYPQGQALYGFSIGGSLGFTHVAALNDNPQDHGSTTAASLGVLLEYGWVLGVQKSFYIGLGAGAKALFIADKEFSSDVTLRYPTARISVGWAF